MNLKNLWNSVLTFLHLIETKGEEALTTANNVVNAILSAEQTPTAQTIESVVEAILPTSLKAAFVLWLPVTLKALKWTDGEIVDGLNYLRTLDGDTKALQAATLAASTAKFVSDNTEGGLTIQQAITANQIVHNPALAA